MRSSSRWVSEVPEEWSSSSAAATGVPTHASEIEYARFIAECQFPKTAQKQLLRTRRVFVERYPDLYVWSQAPLPERIGRISGETGGGRRRLLAQVEMSFPSYPVSYQARPYLAFLALRGSLQLDWEWLLAVRVLGRRVTRFLQMEVAIDGLVTEAVDLGYAHRNLAARMFWPIERMCLRAGQRSITCINDALFDDLEAAIRRFVEHPDVAIFYGSRNAYQTLLDHYTGSN